MIQDSVYYAYFKARWLRITNTLKNSGYDFSNVKLVPEKVTDFIYEYGI